MSEARIESWCWLTAFAYVTATACGRAGAGQPECNGNDACTEDASNAVDAVDADRGCGSDSDCPSGFCDRTGVCGTVDVQLTARYGTPCMPAPRDPAGLVDGKLNTCGPYLCLEGRCRSCVDDAECQIEYGAPDCGQLDNPRFPGNSCGDYSQVDADAGPPMIQVPPDEVVAPAAQQGG